MPDKVKSISRHFSEPDHYGVEDMIISVIKFIKNLLRSEEAFSN